MHAHGDMADGPQHALQASVQLHIPRCSSQHQPHNISPASDPTSTASWLRAAHLVVLKGMQHVVHRLYAARVGRAVHKQPEVRPAVLLKQLADPHASSLGLRHASL
jgi:hypothetical protein